MSRLQDVGIYGSVARPGGSQSTQSNPAADAPKPWWLKEELDRKQAESLVSRAGRPGTFVVRAATKSPGCRFVGAHVAEVILADMR